MLNEIQASKLLEMSIELLEILNDLRDSKRDLLKSYYSVKSYPNTNNTISVEEVYQTTQDLKHGINDIDLTKYDLMKENSIEFNILQQLLYVYKNQFEYLNSALIRSYDAFTEISTSIAPDTTALDQYTQAYHAAAKNVIDFDISVNAFIKLVNNYIVLHNRK